MRPRGDIREIESTTRRVLREAASNPDERDPLRALLKEIRALLDPDEDADEEDSKMRKRRRHSSQ